MRIVALLAAYNEQRYIEACLNHLEKQRVMAYLIDNESTDKTVAVAEKYLDRNLIGIETMPRKGIHILAQKLKRKQELAMSIDSDWFIHMDPDEFRLPPTSDSTLAKSLEMADQQGYNTVHFKEFVFVPTREQPDHDHPDFQNTMKYYYCFEPFPFHRLNAWKKQSQPVDLLNKAGHQVEFPGRNVSPKIFKMRHYHFLSIPHAVRKLVGRPYPQEEIDRGWHSWRAEISQEMITLPSEKKLSLYLSDDELDDTSPWNVHHLGQCVNSHRQA